MGGGLGAAEISPASTQSALIVSHLNRWVSRVWVDGRVKLYIGADALRLGSHSVKYPSSLIEVQPDGVVTGSGSKS